MAGPLLINRATVESITNRSGFYDMMPEFRQLRNLPEPKRKCRSCRKDKTSNNKYRLFVQILSGFDTGAATKLKTYLNVTAIQFIGYNPRTRRTETIVL